MKKINLFHSRGQGMTEYIIIVALIAVAAIGTYGFFGQSLRNQVAGLASEVSGVNSSDNIQAAQDAADEAENLAIQEYNLGNYNEGAAQDAGTGGSGGSSVD